MFWTDQDVSINAGSTLGSPSSFEKGGSVRVTDSDFRPVFVHFLIIFVEILTPAF